MACPEAGQPLCSRVLTSHSSSPLRSDVVSTGRWLDAEGELVTASSAPGERVEDGVEGIGEAGSAGARGEGSADRAATVDSGASHWPSLLVAGRGQAPSMARQERRAIALLLLPGELVPRGPKSLAVWRAAGIVPPHRRLPRVAGPLSGAGENCRSCRMVPVVGVERERRGKRLGAGMTVAPPGWTAGSPGTWGGLLFKIVWWEAPGRSEAGPTVAFAQFQASPEVPVPLSGHSCSGRRQPSFRNDRRHPLPRPL
jgi:hypothetical protein